MAEVGLTFSTGQKSTVGAMAFDALVSESSSFSAKATEYAVEEGAPISDNIAIKPERLKLSGQVTPSDVILAQVDGLQKLIDIRDLLRRIISERQTITVSTGLDTYSDMVMESCDVGRTNEGDHLTVDMELVQIRKAVLRREAIPPAKVTGEKAKGKAGDTKTKAGKANPDKEPSPKVQSMAYEKAFDIK